MFWYFRVKPYVVFELSITPSYQLDRTNSITPQTSLEFEDVWNLVIRLYVSKSISVKKEIEIEIRGWRDLPQQMTQLIAMMIQSGARACKRCNTFMEEMALIECHPSYFSYVEDHLEGLNARKTLLDWKNISHFFTSHESNDAKYRAEREFSSYEFVKKYCERSVVGREEKKLRSLYDDHVWKRLTGKNCIFVLGPSASGKTYSTLFYVKRTKTS